MINTSRMNPYANLQLRRQLYLECRAMAEFALAKGKSVPATVIEVIERFESEVKTDEKSQQPKDTTTGKREPIHDLVDAHETLVKIIDPASPQTVLLLDQEQEANNLWKFLGPVALVRQMMLIAIISLFLFVSLSIYNPFAEVETTSAGIKESLPVFINMLYYLASAAMGACFAGLYKANSYITQGTFDPTHQASYWIRFFLGLISGVVLAVILSDETLKDFSLVKSDIMRPVLAILGGFSADLFYTFLNRMVETFKSLFEGSSEAMIAAQAQEAKSKLASQAVQSRMKLAKDLMKLQKDIGADPDAESVQQRLDDMLKELMPEIDTSLAAAKRKTEDQKEG